MTKNYGMRDGVVGLTVLLIMSVVMTIGLAVGTQSLSQQRQSRQEEESEKALNLAEAGIEELLSQDLDSGRLSVSDPSVQFSVVKEALVDARLSAGHTLDVSLDGANVTNISLSWETANACSGAALIVSVIDDGNNVKRGAYDPCTSSPRSSNGFESAGISSGMATIELNSTNLLNPGHDVKMRVKAVYADTAVSVSGANLPDQSYVVTTTATLDDGTTRTIQVRRSLPMLPSIFDYVLFSGTSIN